MTKDSKFDGLLLGSRLVLLDVLKLGTEEVNELGLLDSELIVTTLGEITTWCI